MTISIYDKKRDYFVDLPDNIEAIEIMARRPDGSLCKMKLQTTYNADGLACVAVEEVPS